MRLVPFLACNSPLYSKPLLQFKSSPYPNQIHSDWTEGFRIYNDLLTNSNSDNSRDVALEIRSPFNFTLAESLLRRVADVQESIFITGCLVNSSDALVGARDSAFTCHEVQRVIGFELELVAEQLRELLEGVVLVDQEFVLGH